MTIWPAISLVALSIGNPTTTPLKATVELPKAVSAAVDYKVELPAPPADAKALQMWVPLPRDDEHQNVREIRAAGTPQFTRDPQTGNRFLYYRFEPASKAPREIAVHFEVVRTASQVTADTKPATPPPSDDLKAWLAPNELLPTDGKAKELSDKIVAGATSDFDKAHKIYDYIIEHMSYDKQEPGWGNADFARACEVGKGNCTDFHGMFLSLCRAQGIPARFEIGLEFAIDGTTSVPGGYHCWASFYDKERGWVPVDISTAWKRSQVAAKSNIATLVQSEKQTGFGMHDAYRVAFTRGLDIQTAPAASKPARYIIDPVIEIDGKRIPSGKPADGGYQRTWSYQFLGEK